MYGGQRSQPQHPSQMVYNQGPYGPQFRPNYRPGYDQQQHQQSMMQPPQQQQQPQQRMGYPPGTTSHYSKSRIFVQKFNFEKIDNILLLDRFEFLRQNLKVFLNISF